jgi:cytochrome c1
MRSSIAKAIAVALGLCIVLLSAAFAVRQNPGAGDVEVETAPVQPVPMATVDEAEVERGRRLFFDVGCTRCHSVQGQGNPRHGLDDVGARRPPSEIRAWMLALGPAEDSVPRSVARAKERFREEPEEALTALVAFLVSLRGGA